MLFASCNMDDDQVNTEPTLSTADAVDLIEQASLAVGADNANWNNIVLMLEADLFEGGQFGFQGQVAGIREYGESGSLTGVSCIANAMPNWVRGELSDIVKEFRGIEVDDPIPAICDSNVDGVINESNFDQVEKLIRLYGYSLPSEFQLVFSLVNDTEGTSDNISTSFIEEVSEFEISVNLVIYEFSSLQQFEFLRVLFQGETIIELPIQ